MGGNSSSMFEKSDLENYKTLTYLQEPDIVNCYKKFKTFLQMQHDFNYKSKNDNETLTDQDLFQKMPEINVNPLKHEIFRVFARGNQRMTFEDYLNMMSVFSENAPFLVKCHYAFKLFDLDDKNTLGRENVKAIIIKLTSTKENKFSENNLNRIVNKIFEEVDLEENNEISMDEFEHIVANSPDFTS